jgi:hypothetical protein
MPRSGGADDGVEAKSKENPMRSRKYLIRFEKQCLR